jgi:hypothetical protein
MVDHPSTDVIKEIQDAGMGMCSVSGQRKIVSRQLIRKCEALGEKIIPVFLSRLKQFDMVSMCLSEKHKISIWRIDKRSWGR